MQRVISYSSPNCVHISTLVERSKLDFSLTTIVADTCPSQRVSDVLAEYDFNPKMIMIVDSVSLTAFA